MECGGCNAYTSSVLAAVRDGRPCPYCGLSAGAILEIAGVRRRKADEGLKERLETVVVERDRAIAEAGRLRKMLTAVRSAVGCELYYKPHDADSSDLVGLELTERRRASRLFVWVEPGRKHRQAASVAIAPDQEAALQLLLRHVDSDEHVALGAVEPLVFELSGDAEVQSHYQWRRLSSPESSPGDSD